MLVKVANKDTEALSRHDQAIAAILTSEVFTGRDLGTEARSSADITRLTWPPR